MLCGGKSPCCYIWSRSTIGISSSSSRRVVTKSLWKCEKKIEIGILVLSSDSKIIFVFITNFVVIFQSVVNLFIWKCPERPLGENHVTMFFLITLSLGGSRFKIKFDQCVYLDKLYKCIWLYRRKTQCKKIKQDISPNWE